MIITDVKIPVTHRMMDSEGMIKLTSNGVELGVPNAEDGGLIWKKLLLLEEEDFDAIEDYFLKKQQSQNHDKAKT